MKEKATVLKNLTNNRALVRIERHSACSKCDQACSMAGEDSEVKEMEFEVENPIKAPEGEKVQIEMGEKPVLFASIVIYLVPLLFMVLGYVAGQNLAPFFGVIEGEAVGVIGAFIFLGIAFLLIRNLDNYLQPKKVFHPEITKIVE